MSRALGVVVVSVACVLSAFEWTAADDVIVKVKPGLTVLRDATVHEAFAAADNFYTDPPVPAPKAPPSELIEEKPAIAAQLEKRAVWIPGYWEWNAPSESYIWTTGVWRFRPPGRRWVPGQWTNTENGFLRSHGHWVPNKTETLVYVTAPPRYQGTFPLTSSLAKDQFWVPGCWTPANEGKFTWREGFITRRVDNWVWIPAQYVWSNRGWVFIDGYWDYPVGARGQAFASLKLGDGPYDAEQIRVHTFAPIPNTAITEAETGNYVYALKEIDLKHEFVSVDTVADEVPEVPVFTTSELPIRPAATLHGVIRRGTLTPANIEVELIGLTGDTARVATTNDQGQFAFTDIPFGVYYLRAAGPVQNHIKRAYAKIQIADPVVDARLELY